MRHARSNRIRKRNGAGGAVITEHPPQGIRTSGAHSGTSKVVGAIRLSQRQLARLVRLVSGARPAPHLMRAFEVHTHGNPTLAIALLQQALADDGPLLSGLSALLTRSRAAEPAELAVFRREGEYWTIQYRGAVARLRHSTGLAHLARLLERPGYRFHAVDLVCAPGRRVPEDSERARVSATKAIGAALSRIEREMPELGHHLRVTVHRGFRCSYTPDPRSVPSWRV